MGKSICQGIGVGVGPLQMELAGRLDFGGSRSLSRPGSGGGGGGRQSEPKNPHGGMSTGNFFFFCWVNKKIGKKHMDVFSIGGSDVPRSNFYQTSSFIGKFPKNYNNSTLNNQSVGGRHMISNHASQPQLKIGPGRGNGGSLTQNKSSMNLIMGKAPDQASLLNSNSNIIINFCENGNGFKEKFEEYGEVNLGGKRRNLKKLQRMVVDL
jgi:hypothetical protein